MKQLEILVLTPGMNEEDMCIMKFEKEREFIEMPPYHYRRKAANASF